MAISTPNPEILPQNPFTGLDEHLATRWSAMEPAEWLPFLEAEAHRLIATDNCEERVWKAFELCSQNAVTSPSRGFYRVESGKRAYTIDQSWGCNCLDQVHRKVTCKHAFAAMILSRAMNSFAQLFRQKEDKVNEFDKPFPGENPRHMSTEEVKSMIALADARSIDLDEAFTQFQYECGERLVPPSREMLAHFLPGLNGHRHDPPEASHPGPTFSHTEAPYSANIKAISPAGFDVMITMRRGIGEEKDFFTGLSKLQEWLVQKGYSPTGKGHVKSDASAGPSDEPEFKTCPIHNAKMKRRKGRSGIFYSHQLADESWCNGREK